MSPLQHVIKSFGYAFQGWRTGFRTQLNFRIQTGFAALTVLAGVYFGLDRGEWFWILLNITLVLAAELFNSSIELLVDLVSPEWNEKAGKVKDLAAGAVTLVALNALIGGLVIFLPKITAFF